MAETLIKIDNLKKHYAMENSLLTQLLDNQRYIHAIDGVSFDIERGEIFGLAGESGCGKTTTGRCLARLTNPTDGKIMFGSDQRQITDIEGSELKELRKEIQTVFQDPYGSINDRFTVQRWVREPLIIHNIGSRGDQEDQVIKTLNQCGLQPAEVFMDQYPHELSGGQRQRVALARAMILDPSFIIADEPTSMLDVSVRASVLRILKQLVNEEEVTILYISHDLSLLRYICDRIGIMYQGKLMEIGTVDDVLKDPKHPYTQSLLSAVPRIDPRKERQHVNIPPDVEEQIGDIQGCPFRNRCPYAFDRCDENLEFFVPDENVNQKVACHLYHPDVNENRPVYDDS